MPELANANGTNNGDDCHHLLGFRESKSVFSALIGKFTVLVALAALWCGTCTAQEWKHALKEKDSDVYIDKRLIKREASSSIVEFWTITIFAGQTAISTKTLFQFDCKRRIGRQLWSYHYQPGDKWGNKPPESVEKHDAPWAEIPPDPPGVSNWKNFTDLICN
jgi:hypothetical protein